MRAPRMTKLLPLAATAALALTGCNQKQEAANQAAAANEAQAVADANVAADMPPPIKSQKTYRCKDASLVYVDFLEGDTQANLHVGEKSASAVALKADAAGKPFTSEGYTLTGTGATITLAQPGKASQSCKA